MRFRSSIRVQLALVAIALSAAATPATADVSRLRIDGANLTGYTPTAPGFRAGLLRAEQTIRHDGGNTVAIVLECWMSDPAATAIDCSKTAPDASTGDVTIPDSDVVAAINEAHRLRLHVVLKPHVDIRNCSSGNCFRGNIQPSDWSAWFAAYRAMMRHYAALAAAHHVDLLVVGTELTTSQSCDVCAGGWNATVDDVRAHYRGALTYAANVDDFASFPAWRRMTVLGDDGYFPLVSDTEVQHGRGDPSVATLVRRWSSFNDGKGRHHWLATLRAFSRRYHKPLVFTEIGYARLYGAANFLNDVSGPSTPDPAAQANAYEALFRAFRGQRWFHGALLWDFQGDRSPPQHADTDFDPRRQPAEVVLTRWWRLGWP